MSDRRQELEVAIAGISKALKNPMSDVERALLVADRKDFREELSKLQPRATQEQVRCKACHAETPSADESGLCAPCRIVRDGLRDRATQEQGGDK
jgi:hypothetical protein